MCPVKTSTRAINQLTDMRCSQIQSFTTVNNKAFYSIMSKNVGKVQVGYGWTKYLKATLGFGKFLGQNGYFLTFYRLVDTENND